jgi:hypothetical protein
MSYRKEVTIEMLREMIDYNPETGDMVWKEREGRARGRATAGQPVGCPRPPYRTVNIYRNKLYVHRVAFALTHGRWPEPFCDHINGNPEDNRACNLREATHLESAHNIRGHKRSRSGVKGVAWHPKNRRWTTRVSHNRRTFTFGCYATVEEAAQAVRAGRERLHGEFARH